MELNKKIVDVIENSGFNYDGVDEDDGYSVRLYQSTPAGEDWGLIIWFDGSDNGFIYAFRKYSESFDVDKEVEFWVELRGKNGIPSSIRKITEILNDAEWKKEKLGLLLKDLEDIDFREDNVLTVFILDHVDDEAKPILYMIPLNKQLEVEKLARSLKVNEYDSEFEDLLTDSHIKYEWMGSIYSAKNRQENWIDDNIARVIVG